MNFFGKLFSAKKTQKNDEKDCIPIYHDTQFRKKIGAIDQTVLNYCLSNQLESQQFLYLTVYILKGSQIIMKDYLSAQRLIAIAAEGSRNTVPRIASTLNVSQGLKFIRSGLLLKYEDSKNSFQDCQLKLHHDYLTYYKNRSKEKKVSFLPLQNATVEVINEKKNIFTVKDKFKTIMFKTNSREDMIGWLVAISEAIKVRNAQIYMSELSERLNKKIRDKVMTYSNKCLNLRDQSRGILLDQIGRKALKLFFKRVGNALQSDIKLLNIIETYMYMLKTRRQRGQSECQQISNAIKESLRQLQGTIPEEILSDRNLQVKHDLVKAIEEIMKYLDKKYKKQLFDKKFMSSTFQTHMLQDYKANSKIAMKSLFGTVAVNQIS